MVADLRLVAEKMRSAQWNFIVTELETAETFANVALAAGDAEKAARNTQNARTGYDTARRFLHELELTPRESDIVEEKFANLAAKLTELGEIL